MPIYANAIGFEAIWTEMEALVGRARSIHMAPVTRRGGSSTSSRASSGMTPSPREDRCPPPRPRGRRRPAPPRRKARIVLRQRPEAVDAGYARVMDFDTTAIWDGTGEAARRTVDVIARFLERWTLPARTHAPPLSSTHPSPSQGPGPSIRSGPKLLLSRHHTTGNARKETVPCPIRLPELRPCGRGVMAQAHQALRGQVHPLREMVQVPQTKRASAAIH